MFFNYVKKNVLVVILLWHKSKFVVVILTPLHTTQLLIHFQKQQPTSLLFFTLCYSLHV